MFRSKLRDVYKELGKKQTDEIVELIRINMEEIMPMIDDFDDDMIVTFAEYVFMITAIDEKVHKKEYYLIRPLINAAFGKECSYEETEKIIFEYGYDEEETREEFRDLLDDLRKTDPELRYRMILLAMYIAAIDDDISRKEKSYIESLL